MERNKEYFRQASARSRARKNKKLQMLDSPLMRQAIAIVTLCESRGCSFEEACKLLDQHPPKTPTSGT